MGECGFVTSVPVGRASTRYRQTRYSLSGRESRFLRACRPRRPCAARVSRRSWRCRLGDSSWPSSRSLRSGGHPHAWSPDDARAALPPGATAAERARALWDHTSTRAQALWQRVRLTSAEARLLLRRAWRRARLRLRGAGGAPASLSSPTAARAIEAEWTRRGFGSPVARTVEIWLFALRLILQELKIRRTADDAEREQMRHHAARTLREGCLRLGPTFIKLGQLASTRVDILPKAYIAELSSLQDKVPPFPVELVKRIVREDFGRPLEEVYEQFEAEPMAAASLGQVHRAVLHGKPVAVKVQRAGLRELFDVDLKNLEWLARLLDWLDPRTDGVARNWLGVYQESARLLYEEIDYLHEADNAKQFASNFAESAGNGDATWVRIPAVIDACTTGRVLTMEYVAGVKITNVSVLEQRGQDLSLLAERLGRFFLEQTLRHGFLHCDPHPGNVSVDEQGRLLVYDFGMCQRLTQQVRRGVVNLVFATYDNDAAGLMEALEQMGVVRPDADRVSVLRIACFFLSVFQSRMDRISTAPPSTPEEAAAMLQAGKTEVRSRLATIGDELLAVADDQPFQFPAVFTFVFRALTSIDGTAKTLDPMFDITRLTKPYLKDLIDLRDGSAMKTALKSTAKALGWRREDLASVVTQPRKVRYIEKVLRKIEAGELKIRVRALEVERSFKVMSMMVDVVGHGILASILVNLALAGMFVSLASLGAAILGVRAMIGLAMLRSLQRRQTRFSRLN